MLDGETQIIQRAITGEASAFGALYDHYQPQIYRFVMVKVSRREEAEDLTHQVFLQAWQRINSYKDLGYPFSSWLYQIARNLVIDHYRGAREHADLDQADLELATNSLEAEEAVETRLEMERVRLAIRKLKPLYQDIIILRFIEDLPIKEVARAIGKSEGAVKLLQHRAIGQLQAMLK